MPVAWAAAIWVACINSVVAVGSRLAMATVVVVRWLASEIAVPAARAAGRPAWSVVSSRGAMAVWLTGPLGLKMCRRSVLGIEHEASPGGVKK